MSTSEKPTHPGTDEPPEPAPRPGSPEAAAEFEVIGGDLLDRLMPAPVVAACGAAAYMSPRPWLGLAVAAAFMVSHLRVTAVKRRGWFERPTTRVPERAYRIGLTLLFCPLLVLAMGPEGGWLIPVAPMAAMPAYSRRPWPSVLLAAVTTLALVVLGATAQEIIVAAVVSTGIGWVGGGLLMHMRREAERAEKLRRDLERSHEQLAVRGRALEVAVDEARRSAAAKSRFLANMSHEVRTPLNGVLGLAVALQDTRLDVEQGELVGELLDSGRLLMTVIDDVLDMQRIAAGKVVPSVESFSLDRVMRRVAARYVSKTVAIELSLPPATPLKGDPVRIEQIVGNFVSNAVKFTESGRVELRAEISAQSGELSEGAPAKVRIEVVDQGIGIPEDRLVAIFEPFEQADGSTTRRFGGTGLGLAICRELAHAMGGEVGAESEVGVGSTFFLALKLEVAPDGEVPAVEPANDSKTGERLRGLRVLVAEDNLINQKVAARFLGRLGCEARVVDDGVHLLACVEEVNPDVVLMDLHMPRLDGLETTRQLRVRQRLEDRAPCPVLALTASVLEEDRRRCFAAGMTGYVTKPMTPHALERALLEAVDPSGAPLDDEVSRDAA